MQGAWRAVCAFCPRCTSQRIDNRNDKTDRGRFWCGAQTATYVLVCSIHSVRQTLPDVYGQGACPCLFHPPGELYRLARGGQEADLGAHGHGKIPPQSPIIKRARPRHRWIAGHGTTVNGKTGAISIALPRETITRRICCWRNPVTLTLRRARSRAVTC